MATTYDGNHRGTALAVRTAGGPLVLSAVPSALVVVAALAGVLLWALARPGSRS